MARSISKELAATTHRQRDSNERIQRLTARIRQLEDQVQDLEKWLTLYMPGGRERDGL